MEYLYILLPYLKRFNQYCGLCIRNCTFGVTKWNHRQLLRCNLRCIGNPTCPFRCSVIVQNNGVGHIVVSNRTIWHGVGTKICRPIRKSLRSVIKNQFSQGASVFRMHQERLQKRTKEERRGRNYDGIGTSRSTFRKIKSEGVIESLLSPAVDDSLSKFQKDVNPGGKVKGTIQILSKYPRQIVVFSETSIRLFDALLKNKNVDLSWDATGSIIKEKQQTSRMLYYELDSSIERVCRCLRRQQKKSFHSPVILQNEKRAALTLLKLTSNENFTFQISPPFKYYVYETTNEYFYCGKSV